MSVNGLKYESCFFFTLVEFWNEENNMANAIKDAAYRNQVKNMTSNELSGKMLRYFNKREQTIRAGRTIKSDKMSHVNQ
jgi:hypothetical protein